MTTPEQQARAKLDTLLQAAGWVVQDRKDFNRKAALGVAVREFQLSAGPCDYLLFLDGKAAGVIEAKKSGVTLSGVAEQSEKYMAALPEHLAHWDTHLLFDYESTGDETFFRDMRDPRPRSRRVFAFHTPVILYAWLKQGNTLRDRLRALPPLDKGGLRDCQIDAIGGLETSLAHDRPRSLIQMTMGAGKTFTACTFSYRLITYAHARRILFLVDRNNLGDQTLKEFQNFQPPGSAHRFTDTYIVQHLHNNRIDQDAKVVITTIQRLYAMVRGEELDPENEETSNFETWETAEGDSRSVAYNPDIPIETFDFIITDECHRSIYGLWRQVLEYFDALYNPHLSHAAGIDSNTVISKTALPSTRGVLGVQHQRSFPPCNRHLRSCISLKAIIHTVPAQDKHHPPGRAHLAYPINTCFRYWRSQPARFRRAVSPRL